MPNLCLHYVELNNKDNKQDRRTMAIIRHMRRSAVSAGRPGGLIREIAWKAGESVNMLTRRFAFVPPCGGY